MSYEERDDYGMYRNHVHNLQNEHLGVIREFMVDMRTGGIANAPGFDSDHWPATNYSPR